MSTKAIREALTRLHSALPVTETHLAARALDEVEAIERAAEDVCNGTHGMSAESMETFERIIKEAP